MYIVLEFAVLLCFSLGLLSDSWFAFRFGAIYYYYYYSGITGRGRAPVGPRALLASLTLPRPCGTS